MTAAVLAAALAARAAAQAAPPAAAPGPSDCPAGTQRAATDDPYHPFRCALPGETPGRSTLTPRPDGPAGFTQRPKCPRGTEPLATPHSLQPYRCVRAGAGVAAAAAPGARYEAAGGLSFESPPGYRMQDAWGDDVPTLYLELDAGRAGRPTSITITRVEPGRAGGATLADAVKRDVDWQDARETKPAAVAGAKARATEVPGRTRSVYLPAGRQSYYAFVYSAPEELYREHLPDFERMLKSVRVEARRP
jgi:hypothetical protein